MRRALRLAPLLSLLVLLPLAGGADEIEIDFDLTGSSVSAVGGQILIPPEGTITAASAKLIVPGTGSVTASSGPASLRSLVLDLTVDATVAGLADVTGTVTASQLGTGFGTLSAGLGAFNLTQSLFVEATGFIDCAGFGCGFVGTFPATFNGTQTFPPPLSIAVGGLGTAGAATVMGSLLLDLAGQTAVLTLVGAETARTFVPEPSRLLQLAAAGGLVVLLFRRVRR